MDIDAWDAWTPADVALRLDQRDGWAVAGGWAIDLFAGIKSRDHRDLEVVTSPEGFKLIERAVPELDWYAPHNGELTAIAETPGILADTWQTWGRDPVAHAWRLDVMREPWHGERWIYRRNPRIGMKLGDAIHMSDSGIPFLATEIVLLFKSEHPQDKDQRDWDLARPLLSQPQRDWLAHALEVEHPTHVWLRELHW